jgi:hypothetical protein
MAFSDLLRPRKEVLSEEGIDGIIDLANLGNPTKLESDPRRFFALTYPTSDIQRVLQKLSNRFQGSKDAPGLFLFEGLKGSGKSHLLLLVYHLFKNYGTARPWLDKHKLYCEVPSDAEVIINKFTDTPLPSIWDFIFKNLTGHSPKKSVVQPSLREVEGVLKNKRLILILDELEQGIRVINDPTLRNQNTAFLQMLSEWANRSDKVTVFASIYSDQEEPGSTLKRVPNCRVQFSYVADRAKVVLHRLFENYLEFKSNDSTPVIDSYLNIWRRHMTVSEEYRSKMLLTYPFLPDVMELIMERVPARGGFQSVRGALGFLANMVRLSHQTSDLITASHANLHDREVVARLRDLDPSGGLILKALGNLEDLKSQPLAVEIASAVMLYSLTSSGRNRGATREELIKHTLTPRVNINDFEKTLLAFQKCASYFHVQEGRYFFDLSEKPEATVEFRSLSVPTERAHHHLHTLWQNEIFREPNSVIYKEVEETKESLEKLDKDRLRYILAPFRLNQEDRHTLYHGIERRNQVILLEPRDQNFNLSKHTDLLKWAQRHIAAQNLAETARDSTRRTDYERIGREDKSNCIETIKRAGLIFTHWVKYGETAIKDEVEEENIPGSSKDDVLRHLSEQLFPTQLFEEHLSKRLPQILNRTVKEVDREYRSTLGFPVPTTFTSVSKALRELCRSGKIGIRHSRGNSCHEDPQLTETELSESIISESFVPSPTTVLTPPPKVVPELGVATPVTTPAPTLALRKEELRIPPQTSSGELRQAVAVRLHEFPDSKINQVDVTIFLEKTTGDLSTLPASIRGNLTGEGTLTAEIRLKKEGAFSKAQVEQIIESLPSIPGADYQARIEILTPSKAENESE